MQIKIKINIEKYLFNGCMPQNSTISQLQLKTLMKNTVVVMEIKR